MSPERDRPLHGNEPEVRLLGFTLVELLISLAIMGTLAGMATISYKKFIHETRGNVAMTELKNISVHLELYRQEQGEYPESLDDLGLGQFLDPWGNPYQYQALDKVPKGMWRKDHFLVPLNNHYDLWSMGPDGRTAPPLTSKLSRDDIIRATDGGYIGPASQY
ncbi:MAG: type II secretion system protein GspG [Deltaproteobacteria bacterium]|nr:type II secretion system protein GspG [Deltaproteobacteria bacterium]